MLLIALFHRVTGNHEVERQAVKVTRCAVWTLTPGVVSARVR